MSCVTRANAPCVHAANAASRAHVHAAKATVSSSVTPPVTANHGVGAALVESHMAAATTDDVSHAAALAIRRAPSHAA